MSLRSKPLIVIIGAGVSGLSCAYHLNQRPEDSRVIVLEARDRIGGRTWTKQFGVAAVDCGASWVHGTKDNPVAELAPKIGLQLYQKKKDFDKIQNSVSSLSLPNATFLAWDDKGNDLSTSLNEFATAFENMASFILHESAVLQKKKNLSQPDQTIEQALATKIIKSGFQERWKNKLGEELFQKAWNWRAAGLESYVSAPLATISLRWYQDQESKKEIGGNRHTINGYRVLVEHLAEDIKIETNRPIASITKSGNKVIVKDIKGDSMEADYVVCTLPLGVLKKEVVTFEPKLSEKKQIAIQSLGMGFLNKVVLHFSQVFWPPQTGWMSFVGGTKDSFGDVKSLFKKTGEPVLVFYLAPGLSTRREKEGWTEEETIKRCLDILSFRFGESPVKYFISGLATDLHVTEWQKDPFSYGSYSYIALGSEGQHYDWLSEPEMDGYLRFAGEATERNSPSTVQGAFVSGRREAHRLLSHIYQQRRNKNKPF